MENDGVDFLLRPDPGQVLFELLLGPGVVLLLVEPVTRVVVCGGVRLEMLVFLPAQLLCFSSSAEEGSGEETETKTTAAATTRSLFAFNGIPAARLDDSRSSCSPQRRDPSSITSR